MNENGFFKLLSKEFEKQLSHGIDGLIFQPVDEVFDSTLIQPKKKLNSKKNLKKSHTKAAGAIQY